MMNGLSYQFRPTLVSTQFFLIPYCTLTYNYLGKSEKLSGQYNLGGRNGMELCMG